MASSIVAKVASNIIFEFDIVRMEYATKHPEASLLSTIEFRDFEENEDHATIAWSKASHPERTYILEIHSAQRLGDLETFIWIEPAYVDTTSIHWPRFPREEVVLSDSFEIDVIALQGAIRKLYEFLMAEPHKTPEELELQSRSNEQIRLGISVGEDLTREIVRFMEGEIDFAELVFTTHDAVEYLHAIKSGDYVLFEIEADEEPQTPPESGQAEEDDEPTNEEYETVSNWLTSDGSAIVLDENIEEINAQLDTSN